MYIVSDGLFIFDDVEIIVVVSVGAVVRYSLLKPGPNGLRRSHLV